MIPEDGRRANLQGKARLTHSVWAVAVRHGQAPQRGRSKPFRAQLLWLLRRMIPGPARGEILLNPSSLLLCPRKRLPRPIPAGLILFLLELYLKWSRGFTLGYKSQKPLLRRRGPSSSPLFSGCSRDSKVMHCARCSVLSSLRHSTTSSTRTNLVESRVSKLRQDVCIPQQATTHPLRPTYIFPVPTSAFKTFLQIISRRVVELSQTE